MQRRMALKHSRTALTQLKPLALVLYLGVLHGTLRHMLLLISRLYMHEAPVSMLYQGKQAYWYML